MNPTNKKKPVVSPPKAGRDSRRGIWGDPGTFTTSSRGGVTFPNEDVSATITREQFVREGRG